MPHRAARPCCHPGCSDVTLNRFCAAHQSDRLLRDIERQNSPTRRLYDYEWRRYSKRFLKQNPYCAACGRSGRIRFATVTDHIVPHRGDQSLFWDSRNHQSLCAQCHNIKSGTEVLSERVR